MKIPLTNAERLEFLVSGLYYPLVPLNILSVARLIPHKKCLFSGFMTWMSHSFCVWELQNVFIFFPVFLLHFIHYIYPLNPDISILYFQVRLVHFSQIQIVLDNLLFSSYNTLIPFFPSFFPFFPFLSFSFFPFLSFSFFPLFFSFLFFSLSPPLSLPSPPHLL